MIYPDNTSIDQQGLLRFTDLVHHQEGKLYYLNGCRSYYLEEAPQKNPLIYAFYENLYLKEHEALFKDQELTYNIKLILPGQVGGEYHKTVPHFHLKDDLTQETYPEIHEILAGEGVFLLQKNKADQEASQVISIPFAQGDHIYIKNGFGQTTINTGPGPLIIASLIKKEASKNFVPLTEKKGLLYHLFEEGEQASYELNPHYQTSAALEILPPPKLHNPLDYPENLYESFLKNPDAFSVLGK